MVSFSISQALSIVDVTPVERAPAYFEGGRLLVAVPISVGRRSVSVSFTPTSTQLDLEAFGGCNGDANDAPSLSVRIVVDGHLAMTNRCADNVVFTAGAVNDEKTPTNKVWPSLGVQAGRPATLTVQFLHPPRHAAGSFAVYEHVPVAQFRFPPRPAHLALPAVGSNNAILDARRNGSNGAFTVVVPVGQQLDLITAAPGQLTVGCGAAAQNEGVESWRYQHNDLPVDVTACPTLAQHETNKLTVVASGFTAPGWLVTESAPGASTALAFPSLTSPSG